MFGYESSAIVWSFGVLTASAMGLYVLAHVSPLVLVRSISVPWAFQLRRSTDLRYQAVLYRALHTHAWARVSHYSLVWDQVLWAALLYALHPAVLLVVVALLLVQAVLLRAPRFAALLAVVWLVLAAFGAGVVVWLGPPTSARVAMIGLVLGGFLRVAGHIFEPIPPGIVSPDAFVPMRALGWGGRCRSALAGLVCEFAAGFPFRLFLLFVMDLGETLGVGATTHGNSAEHVEHAREVHRGGWAASPVTAWMREVGHDGGAEYGR